MPRHVDPRAAGERPERARTPRREPEPAVPVAHDAASLALLARSSPSGGAELMRSLQHGVGNASLQAMLSPVPEDAGPGPNVNTTVERYAFEAETPRGPAPEHDRETVASGGRSDAPAGMEEDPIAAVASVVGGQVAAAPEEAPPAGGASAAPAAAAPGTEEAAGTEEEITVSLPDIEVPALAAVAKTDAVSP